jgi:hypothetical protein
MPTDPYECTTAQGHILSQGPEFHRLIAIRRILVLWALAAAAHAQSADPSSVAAEADRPQNSGFSVRFEPDLASRAVVAPGMDSDVYTSAFRLRTLDERAQWQYRFGLHAADPGILQPTLMHQTPIPGSSRFNFVQELRWPGGLPLTGLQYERKNFLVAGDHLSIRSTSDVQALARGIGLLGSGAGTDLMSLMGWRSHSRLEWQLGEPTRELQWRFSARLDRRSASQSSAVQLQVLRRF